MRVFPRSETIRTIDASQGANASVLCAVSDPQVAPCKNLQDFRQHPSTIGIGRSWCL